VYPEFIQHEKNENFIDWFCCCCCCCCGKIRTFLWWVVKKFEF